LQAAVVADLLQNFNGPSGKISVYYHLSRCEILLPQISRLPQSTYKFEANENHHTIFFMNHMGNVSFPPPERAEYSP